MLDFIFQYRKLLVLLGGCASAGRTGIRALLNSRLAVNLGIKFGGSTCPLN